MEKEQTFFCEFCKTEVPLNAASCPGCGRSFSAVKCPECGKIGPKDIFINGCPVCGYAAKPTVRAGFQQQEKNKRKKLSWWWFYAAALVAIVGLTALLFVL